MALPDYRPEQPTFFGPDIPNVLKNWFQKLWTYINGQVVVADLKAAAFIADINTFLYPIDTTAGAVVATLPLAANLMGKQFAFIRKVGGNNVTFAVQGGDAFIPAAPAALAVVGASATFVSDGITTWYQIK